MPSNDVHESFRVETVTLLCLGPDHTSSHHTAPHLIAPHLTAPHPHHTHTYTHTAPPVLDYFPVTALPYCFIPCWKNEQDNNVLVNPPISEPSSGMRKMLKIMLHNDMFFKAECGVISGVIIVFFRGRAKNCHCVKKKTPKNILFSVSLLHKFLCNIDCIQNSSFTSVFRLSPTVHTFLN